MLTNGYYKTFHSQLPIRIPNAIDICKDVESSMNGRTPAWALSKRVSAHAALHSVVRFSPRLTSVASPRWRQEETMRRQTLSAPEW